MVRLLIFSLLLLTSLRLPAQTQALVTYISFDKPNCEVADEDGNPNIQTFVNGTLACDCGVSGDAIRLDGDDDWFFVFGDKIEDAFSTIDFSLSFYFHPVATANENQVLFSKRMDCSNQSYFAILFNPFTKIMNVNLTESSFLTGSLTKTLPSNACWYHVVVVRKGAATILYVNGEEMGRVNSASGQRVNVENDRPLTVGSSDCTVDRDFNGFLDEIRIYSRALTDIEIDELYLSPDEIANGLQSSGAKDTTIFIGNSVQIELTSTCATDFVWTPATGVSDVSAAEPLITPTETTTYFVQLSSSDYPCITTDSIRIEVIDPATLDCTDVLLPSAFTPNADGLNDGFGISNPYVAGEILAFEIFDRWGNMVFATTNPLEKWDANYKSQPVNPGVFLYRLHFRCKGEERVKSGSVTVLR